MKVFPLFGWTLAHAVTIQKVDLSEWNILWVTVLCVVKKTEVILLLYSLKSFPCPVLAYVTTHTSRQNLKLLVAIWWSVPTYPFCCSNWSSTLNCAKAVECFSWTKTVRAGNVLNKTRFCGTYKTTLRKKLPNRHYNALWCQKNKCWNMGY